MTTQNYPIGEARIEIYHGSPGSGKTIAAVRSLLMTPSSWRRCSDIWVDGSDNNPYILEMLYDKSLQNHNPIALLLDYGGLNREWLSKAIDLTTSGLLILTTQKLEWITPFLPLAARLQTQFIECRMRDGHTIVLNGHTSFDAEDYWGRYSTTQVYGGGRWKGWAF